MDKMNELFRMLEMVSRTFALSIRYLPEEVRDSLCVAYLLLRVSDTLEDHHSLTPDIKVRMLARWEDVLFGRIDVTDFLPELDTLDNSDPDVLVAQRAEFILEGLHSLPDQVQGIIIQSVAKTTRGMAHWQTHGPSIETVDELDDYMFQVAGRVGYLVTNIFAWYSPRIMSRKKELMPMARELGLGLQTVNVIRGLRSDYERGWVFVPNAYLRSVGITKGQLFDPNYEDGAMRIVNMLCDKSETHLLHGVNYISALPKSLHRLRLACMWPLFFALRTITLSRNDTAVVNGEVKMTRKDVKTIMRRTTFFGWSNRWMHYYFKALASPLAT